MSTLSVSVYLIKNRKIQWMDESIHEWMNRCMVKQLMNGMDRWTSQMNWKELMDEWKYEKERKDERMDK